MSQYATWPVRGGGGGGGVTSLNTLTGAVTLAAGTNITLTPVGNTITIDSAGGGGSSIGGAITGGTAGSVLFVNPNAIIAQDNAKFFWDDSAGSLLLKRNTNDGSSATLQALGAGGALGTASNVSVSFSPDFGSPYLIANGSVWNFTVYVYYTYHSITYYDVVGTMGGSMDPNDGMGYNPQVSWTQAAQVSGYFVYDQTKNQYYDAGNSTSATFLTTNTYVPGLPPSTPSAFPNGNVVSFLSANAIPTTFTSLFEGGLNIVTGSFKISSGNATLSSGSLSVNGTTTTTVLSATTATVSSSLSLSNTANMSFSTATGTKIGTATTQKIGFWNATPIVQPANTVAIDSALVNIGLRASGGTANFATTIKPRTGGTAAGSEPLQFTSASLLTTATAGTEEFLTDKRYTTITTGAARKEYTLNDAALTSGRVPFATTNGRLTDDADMTFATDTLTVTKLVVGGGASLSKLDFGTYTPTLTNVANLDASTAYSCQWMLVGNTVTVSGRVDVDPTIAATTTQLGISLPVASNFANSNECGGTAFANAVAAQGAAIMADATNDRAQMEWKSGDITNQGMWFTFTYRII